MRPMRVIALIVALAALPLPAPAAVAGGMASSGGPASWDAFLAQQRGENEGANLGDGRWVLVLRPEDAADSWWMADDTFRRLQASQEFRVVQLGAAVGRDLWSDRGWNNDAKWILLDPAAERIKELNGRPTGEQALAELKGLGFKPRWERREAFLREHPDHGEACAEALQQGMTLVFTRYQQYQKEGRIVRAEIQAPPPGPFAAFGRSGAMTFATGADPSGATLADEAYGDAAEALRHLVEIKGWQDFQGLFMAALAYQNMGAAQSPKMKALAPRMAQELQDELARNPHNESAWLQFGALARAAGLSPMDAFRKAVPVPGQPWPPVPLLTAVVQEFAAREDWEGAYAFLREFETLAADPGLSKEGWRAYTGTRASLEVGKAQCLARLGRWNEVGPALQEVQRWAGSRWDGQYARALRFAIPELRGERQEQFKALMDAEDLPDLPAPAPPPALRLVLLGAPPWKESWDRLRKAAPLQPWAPGELAWEQLTGPALEAALQKHGWPKEPPRYALFRGDEVLASGVGCPYPEDLAARLAALQPSRYGRLSDLIRKHPDHLATRKARAELAFARMPNGHLEPTLAEDARIAQLVPDTGAPGWTPNPELWQWSAQKVLPEAERALQAWPTRAAAWKLWMGWARFHPSNPSPLAFARTLPVWGSESRWASRLPKEVHLTVAEELRRVGRFEEMRAWFQEAWDGLDKRPLPSFRAFGNFRSTLLQQRREQGEAIAAPLKEALTVLRRNAEVKQLDEALRAMLGTPDPSQDPAVPEPPARPGRPRGTGPGPGGLPQRGRGL